MADVTPVSVESAPDTSPPRTPSLGERLGRYLLEEQLGNGGMGTVYRARDELLQREVALKMISPEYYQRDAAAGLRFLREAEIVARLDHPNIIGLLDAGLDSGVAFMTFQYVSGPSFSTHLRQVGPLTEIEAAELLLPVISAVAYAHAKGVVHGDLKPTNLILGRDYVDRVTPRVLDFGVSFFTSVEPALDPTRRKVAGTPGYLAPEWLNLGELDARLDCFSLGCILYECITGKSPFSHCRRLSEAAVAATHRDYDPPSKLQHVSTHADEIVGRALAPNPAERYRNVVDLGRDLLSQASPATRLLWQDEFGWPNSSGTAPARDK